jgi:high-affinity nickel-transport protein
MSMKTLLIGLALGLRHGTDADHLTAIDGLSRIRPRATNGLYFALGHGLVVTILAVGLGRIVADRVAFVGPWLLIFIGGLNLLKLFRPPALRPAQRPVVAQPFVLGMLLAAGFETASQFSAMILAGETNPWLLGAVFTAGMVAVDGIDGLLASSTQRLAASGAQGAQRASRALGVLVVIFAFGLGGAELEGLDLDRFALPLGLSLFAVVILIRLMARWPGRPAALAFAPADARTTAGQSLP